MVEIGYWLLPGTMAETVGLGHAVRSVTMRLQL